MLPAPLYPHISISIEPLRLPSVCLFFRTVWKKTQSGLQFWGTRWLRRDAQRVRCPHYQFERGDYSLQIRNVMQEDAGLFSCTVKNADGFIKHQVMLRIIQGKKKKNTGKNKGGQPSNLSPRSL